jgi:MarR family transcriptional regulator for hemolysin
MPEKMYSANIVLCNSLVVKRMVEQVAQVYRGLRSLTRRHSAEISPRPFVQLRALATVRDEAIGTQAALAERMAIDAPAASRLVDRLVEDGLLTRCVGADRRCVRLAVTGAADREIAQAEQVLDQVEAELLRHLTAAEARTLAALLGKLAAGLEQAEPPPMASRSSPR